MLVIVDVYVKNKDKKVSEFELDYDIDESDVKINKVIVISVGGGIDIFKKFIVKSDILLGGGGRIIFLFFFESVFKFFSYKLFFFLLKLVK